jgi:D-alanyl-D-alanine dipeptidase
MVIKKGRPALFLLGALAIFFSFYAPRQSPPVETGSFREADLVELTTLDATVHLDIRYATSNNLVGRPVYEEARAFLQRPAAEAVVRANLALRAKGYGLLVFDGYRPWSVTKIFWDVTPPENRKFVADPKVGSKHNRGCAVDLTLYDLRSGLEVEMPSPFDEMSDRASPTYTGGTPAQREHRDLLSAAMVREGFLIQPDEWWHFDYKDWKDYRILDIPFRDVGKK